MSQSNTAPFQSSSASVPLAKKPNYVWGVGSLKLSVDKALCLWTILIKNEWPDEVPETMSDCFWHKESTRWCMALTITGVKYWYLCFHLLSSQRDPPMRAKVTASVIHNGTKTEIYQDYTYTNNSPKKTEMKDIFMSLSNCLGQDITSGVITLEGEVSICSAIAESTCNMPQYLCPQRLPDDLGALLDSGDHADVVLRTGGTELRAHRAILSARSPVFAAMLRHNMREAESGSIDIKDVDTETMRELLRYIYTGRVPVSKNLADKLLAAADKYDLPQLKEWCEIALKNSLTIENAAALADIALKHSCNSLLSAVVGVIKRNFLRALDTDSWFDVVARNPELIRLITGLIARKHDK